MAQYERLGGITAFLTQYLEECLTHGNALAPLEREATVASEKIYAARSTYSRNVRALEGTEQT